MRGCRSEDTTIRINVTGNAGAGKTTLAARLGEALRVPVFSLDSVVWKPGWQKTPPDERRAAEHELVARPSWVIDGVSTTVRQASDLVVFLDVSRSVCAWRGLKRNLRYFTRTRPGLPDGCPEWQILPRLLGIVWRFPLNAGSAIRQEAEQHPSRYRIVRRLDDASALVEDLGAHHNPSFRPPNRLC